MRSIQEFRNQPLVWQRVGIFSSNSELLAGDERIATLTSQSAWTARAEGVVAEGRWTFRDQGIFRSRVTARAAGQSIDAAVFFPNWRGEGVIRLADGGTWRWRSSFWGGKYGLGNDSGEPWIRAVTKLSWRARAEVTFGPEAPAPLLPFATLLSLFLLDLTHRRAAAT